MTFSHPARPTLQFALRLVALRRAKMALTVLLILWVCLPYYVLQHHQIFPVTMIEPGALDRLVPFSDDAVWIYQSLYLLMPLAPWLMTGRNELRRYAMGMAGISLVADVIFVFWPTSVPRPSVVGTNWDYRLLVTIDAPLHALPSLHAGFALFSALCCQKLLHDTRQPRIWRTALWFWTLAILYAAAATKQHVLPDLLAGSALGVLGYVSVFRLASLSLVKPPRSSTVIQSAPIKP